MKKSIGLMGLAALLAAACSREFPAPPALPVIDSISPALAFMGDTVTLEGANFAAEAEANLVFFGSASARVLSASAGLLTVEVPQLQDAEQVYLKVATAQGQGSSAALFAYAGPGHPLAEDFERQVQVRLGPIALTPGRYVDGQPLPLFVINSWSRTVHLVDTSLSAHVGIGVTDTPISLARVFGGAQTQLAYVTTLRSDIESAKPSRLQIYPLDLAGDLAFSGPQEVSFPDMEGGDFLPAQVWSFCTNAECSAQTLAVFDLYRPALALLSAGAAQAERILDLAAPGAGCQDDSDYQGRFVDLVRHGGGEQAEANARLLAAMVDSPEIWSLPEAGADCARRLWPTDDQQDHPLAQARFSALALCGDDLRLYAADEAGSTVVEFSVLGTGSELALTPTGRAALSLGRPFAMTCGVLSQIEESSAAAERLYVATDEGIMVLDLGTGPDITAELVRADFLPLTPAGGSAQSLVRMLNQDQETSLSRGDQIVFADLMRDRVLVLPVGYESSGMRSIALGSPLPQIAASRFQDLIYLADPFANMIGLVERNSGIRSAQFPVSGINSFGATDISVLPVGAGEALFVPLPPPAVGVGKDCEGYDRLIMRLAESADSLAEWNHEWHQVGYQQKSDFLVEFDIKACFHELLPAPSQLKLFLVRYGTAGAIWAREVAAEARAPGDLIREQAGSAFLVPLSAGAKLVRLSPSEDLLGFLSADSKQQATIELVPVADPDGAGQIPIDAYTYLFTSDLAIKVVGQSPVVMLALPSLRQVAIFSPPDRLHVVQTAGEPARLFLSPDGRRLYVTHAKESRLSIIDTGCSPAGECERVTATIDLDSFPAEVVFAPSGDRALVTHRGSNAISVIE